MSRSASGWFLGKGGARSGVWSVAGTQGYGVTKRSGPQASGGLQERN